MELEFKAWLPKIKTMSLPGPLNFWFQAIVDTGVSPFKHHPDIIFLQYIGLKDRSNPAKKIYNGDIISFKCHHCEFIHNGAILWLNEIACYGIRDEDGQIAPLQTIVDIKDIEKGISIIDIQHVLGNIYETPELLKVK